MIEEVIVVEGKNDIAAVKKAVDCECILTHGHGFPPSLLEELAEIQERRGIIVLTDPDYAGKKIRARIRQAIPGAKMAYIERSQAFKEGDIGVENASPEAIRQALEKAHASSSDRRLEFSKEDMLIQGLEAAEGARERRLRLAAELGIGYSNASAMLDKLNDYGIQREEFEEAMARVHQQLGEEAGKRGEKDEEGER